MAIYLTNTFTMRLSGDGESKTFSFDITKAPLFSADPEEPSAVIAQSPCLGPPIDNNDAGVVVDNIPFTATLKKSTLTITFERAPLAPGLQPNGFTITEQSYPVGIEFRYNGD